MVHNGIGDLQTNAELKSVSWDAHARNIDKLPDDKDMHYNHL